MPNAIKKLKQEEKKVVLAYAQLKLKANRLSKELDTMKQNIVDCFVNLNATQSGVFQRGCWILCFVLICDFV